VVWVHADDMMTTAGKVRDAIARFPQAKFVVLANIPTDDDALAALGAGAHGYCNAYAAPEVLKEVAEVVTRGGLWVGESLLSRLLAAMAKNFGGNPAPAAPPDGPLSRLTDREIEIAREIARGRSNKEIAGDLGIAERTVKSHLTVIFEKLGVRDRLQLALICSRLPPL